MTHGTDFKIGQQVTFHCHLLGNPKGTITRFIKCITNGQVHAEIELAPPYPKTCAVVEPLERLKPV